MSKLNHFGGEFMVPGFSAAVGALRVRLTPENALQVMHQARLHYETVGVYGPLQLDQLIRILIGARQAMRATAAQRPALPAPPPPAGEEGPATS